MAIRIVIRSVEKPTIKKPEDLIDWFCEVFGIGTESGAADAEERIFKAFAYAAFENKGLSSSDPSLRQGLARSTVIYHLNRLISMGLITKQGRKYHLRANEMSKVIEELEYDINREMMRMLDAAHEFDRLMLRQRRTRSPRAKISKER
ncbi:MAG: winged helix-turn-helix domain-containing protein [Candidatus Marsarchaeota archaeon]|jgi:predicted transcriptional regulator|nr:winged helix-turn-helix domain-containing protein [Candidatus Marsarchaeota archaeon]